MKLIGGRVMSLSLPCAIFLNETNNFFLRSDHTAKSKLPIGPTWPMQPWPMQPISLRHHPKDPTRRPGPPPGPPQRRLLQLRPHHLPPAARLCFPLRYSFSAWVWLLPFVSLLPLPWPLACSNWLCFLALFLVLASVEHRTFEPKTRANMNLCFVRRCQTVSSLHRSRTTLTFLRRRQRDDNPCYNSTT